MTLKRNWLFSQSRKCDFLAKTRKIATRDISFLFFEFFFGKLAHKLAASVIVKSSVFGENFRQNPSHFCEMLKRKVSFRPDPEVPPVFTNQKILDNKNLLPKSMKYETSQQCIICYDQWQYENRSCCGF
jgi:hypothetical protein